MSSFVLIPGAWLGGWVWKKVTPILAEGGHDVYPITLTGMGDRVHLASKDVGIETAIQDVLNVIKYNDLNDFVLVGHSFAGKVAGAVADRMPEKVRLLLYLDALRPDKMRDPQAGFDPAREFGPVPEEALGVPLTDQIIENIGKDVKGDDRKWMLSKATPWLLKLAKDPITLSEKFDSVKSAYIFCTQSGDPVEEIVSGKWGELYGPHKLIETGHWPMITKPEELVEDMISLSG